MAEFNWGVFSEEVGKVTATAVADIQAREDDKRKLALYKEKTKIDLEGLNRELQIKEPFEEKADKRIEDRLIELANVKQGLKEDWLDYESKYKTNLEASLYDPVFVEMKNKAVKSGDTAQQTLILGLENEINAVLGGQKEFDPRALKGLSPIATQNVAKISYERSLKKNEIRQADERIQNDEAQTGALKEYRKELERGRERTEQRLGISATEVSAQRWSAERTRLDTAVEKAETTFDKYRTELFAELEDTNKINAKGEAFATIGGKKKIKLINPDTGEFNEEAIERFVKKYTRYRGRFKRLRELRKNKETRNQRRDEFFGGEPAGRTAKAEVPEAEIRAAMEMGLTREQAIEQYRKFLATKR